MYAVKMRVAANGMPYMDSDDEFNIDGIVDSDSGRKYYPFDFSEDAENSYIKAITEHDKWPARAISFLNAEDKLSWIAFPPILFTLFIIAVFGAGDPRLVSYLEMLKESVLVSWAGLGVGCFLTLAFLFRVVLLNVAEFTTNLVPNRFGDIVQAIKRATKYEAQKWGLMPMMAGTSVRYLFAVLLALVVATYGLSNALQVPNMAGANLWQSVLGVLSAIPAIGDPLVSQLANDADRSWLAVHFTSGWYSGVIRFLLSSVLLGFLAKVFSYARSKD